MAPRPEVVEFRPPEVEVVLARMQELDRAHAGWLNLQPAVHAVQDLHQRRSALSWLFSVPGPGPELTLGTWTAGPVRHRGPEPPSVGIQHGRQDRARVVLAGAGAPVPPGWRVLEDRPRFGFVARVRPGAGDAEVLAWLLRAIEVMSPVPLSGTWRALVHRRG